MREETHLDIFATCIYCVYPIYGSQLPCKKLEDGRNAHLSCFIDHLDDEKKPNS